MEIDKAQLVEILRARGDHELADRANLELPARVDSAAHREFFEGLQLDAGDAARHAGAGHEEDMSGLATSEE